MVYLMNRLNVDYGDNDPNYILDLKANFEAVNGAWEIVECDNTNKLVVKNTSGVLNYDPYVIFYTNPDNDNHKEFYPCKDYDSSKAPDEQEGIVANDDGNIERFNLNFWSSYSGSNYSSLRMVITDTAFFFKNRTGSYSHNTMDHFAYSIFDCIDKDTGGIYIYSTRHQTPDKHFLWYNNKWYGDTDTGLNNVKFIKDIDKSSHFRHSSSPTGSTLSSPISFFIDVNTDTSINEWQYVGCTVDKYTAGSNTMVNIKQPDGSNKLCYIIKADPIGLGIAAYQDDITIIG